MPWEFEEQVFYDNFESLLKWAIVGGGALAKDNTKAFVDSNSLKITTQAVLNDETGAEIFLFQRGSRMRLGFKLITAETTDFEVYIKIYFWDGTNKYTAIIKFDKANTKWQYYDSACVYQDITNLGIGEPFTANYWAFIELYVDFSTIKYQKLCINNQFADINASMKSDIDATKNKSLEIELTCKSVAVGGVAKTINIDCVDITQWRAEI